MKKDIEWLRCKLEYFYELDMWNWKQCEPNSKEQRHFGGCLAAIEEALGLLDQLDEPEVLSQELPVIPSYVAEYLELAKREFSLMRVLEKANRRDELLFLKWEKEYAWISANDETFARAWLAGYKVAAEEPPYYALVKGHQFLAGDFKYFNLDVLNNVLFVGSRTFILDRHLTEMSKSEWNKLGINDSNADFLKTEDVEE